MSLGNAYHYFQSKEDLMQAFYEDLCDQQRDAVEKAVVGETALRARLIAAISACLAVLQPHRQLLSSLFAFAGAPQSRLNPFGEHTRTIRERSVEMFALVLSGSGETPPSELREDLPYLLWVYYMGILFLWLHDSTFGWARTTSVLNNSASLLCTIVMALKIPAPSPVRRPVIDLLRDIRAFVS